MGLSAVGVPDPETLAATSLALIGLSWPATVAASATLPAGVMTSPVLGLFYLALGAVLAALSLPSFPGKTLLSAVIVIAAVRFLLSGADELSGSTVVERATGASGYVIAVLGLYGGPALVLEEASAGRSSRSGASATRRRP